MEHENPHSELVYLLEEQSKTRRDEVFGGLSEQERSEYNGRAERIHELDAQLQRMANTDRDAAEQTRGEQESQTETPSE
jgi:hypothetical protein